MPVRPLLVVLLLTLPLLPAAVVLRPAPAPAPGSAPGQGPDELIEAYHAAAEAGDAEALVALWREHANRALVTIDADLERSLSLREQSEVPDEAAIAALHARALFGARAASRATGHPIFIDYATAFTSWDAYERERFRAGQAAFRRASEAAKAGDHAASAAAARECLELAEPLGDWWGTAMGHAALGRAQLAQGDGLAALVSLSRARLIHHDLGLQGAEYGNVRAMIDACEALGETARGREALVTAIHIGRELGDDDGVDELAARLDAHDAAAGAGR